MRTAMIIRVAAVAATSALLAMSTAAMASPARRAVQHWSEVTPGGEGNIANVGLALGTNGVLNIFWASNGLTPGKAAIMDTPVTFKGTVGRATAVVSHQYTSGDPDATVTGSRIDVVWDGTSKTPGGQSGTFVYTRKTAGGKWSELANVPTLPGAADTSEDTATTGADGKPWFSVSGTGSLLVDHLGFAERQDSPPACCVYHQGLAVDGKTGATWIAYLALITHGNGIWAQRLNNNGTRAGKPIRLPGSEVGGNVLTVNQRIGITGRGHGRPGVYATYLSGYPFGLGIDLYKMGARKATLIAKTTDADQFYGSTVTADSKGGLWVAWMNGGGATPGLWVRQSNSAVTRWGKALHVALPHGTKFIWNTYIMAAGTRLDIVCLLTVGSKYAFYYTQV